MKRAASLDALSNIRQGLADRAPELFERLFDKPSKRTAREWRWGKKWSLVLYMRGHNGAHWHCYESCQGGDMLAAIQHALGLDFVGALDWARGWLGMPEREGRRHRQHRAEPPPAGPKPSTDFDAEQAGKARRAAELSAAASPIAGTLAEIYLREHRGITAKTWPDALRFADAATVKRCTRWRWWRWPALLVRATDAAGEVTGAQLVALLPDGTAAKHWEHGGKLKLSFGMLAGSAVRLSGDDHALLLAEGPETGLSCWHATGIETWANLGSIAKAPIANIPLDRLIVICADDDARNAVSNKALREAIQSWRREGRRAVLVKPHRLTKRDKSDFNDVLRAEGCEAVRDRILSAIEDRPAARALPSIDEAREQATELIDRAIDDLLAAPGGNETAPFKVAKIPTGVGKTEIAIRRAVTEGAKGAKIIFLVPTHKLGGETISRINRESRKQGVEITVDVWLGRNQERPDDPYNTMCSELKTIGLSYSAKVDPKAICDICPARVECPYIHQIERTEQIWIAAHDMLWHGIPKPLKGADLVLIDESFSLSGLTGFSGAAKLITPDELNIVPLADRVAVEADIHDRLMPAREKMAATLRGHPDGGLRRDRLNETLS